MLSGVGCGMSGDANEDDDDPGYTGVLPHAPVTAPQEVGGLGCDCGATGDFVDAGRTPRPRMGPIPSATGMRITTTFPTVPVGHLRLQDWGVLSPTTPSRDHPMRPVCRIKAASPPPPGCGTAKAVTTRGCRTGLRTKRPCLPPQSRFLIKRRNTNRSSLADDAGPTETLDPMTLAFSGEDGDVSMRSEGEEGSQDLAGRSDRAYYSDAPSEDTKSSLPTTWDSHQQTPPVEIPKHLHCFEIFLNGSGSAGLGLSVKGRSSDKHHLDLGIFIKAIFTGGAAHKDSRLRVNDQLVTIHGRQLLGHYNESAMAIIRTAMQELPVNANHIQVSILRTVDAGDLRAFRSPLGSEEGDAASFGGQSSSIPSAPYSSTSGIASGGGSLINKTAEMWLTADGLQHQAPLTLHNSTFNLDDDWNRQSVNSSGSPGASVGIEAPPLPPPGSARTLPKMYGGASSSSSSGVAVTGGLHHSESHRSAMSVVDGGRKRAPQHYTVPGYGEYAVVVKGGEKPIVVDDGGGDNYVTVVGGASSGDEGSMISRLMGGTGGGGSGGGYHSGRKSNAMLPVVVLLVLPDLLALMVRTASLENMATLGRMVNLESIYQSPVLRSGSAGLVQMVLRVLLVNLARLVLLDRLADQDQKQTMGTLVDLILLELLVLADPTAHQANLEGLVLLVEMGPEVLKVLLVQMDLPVVADSLVLLEMVDEEATQAIQVLPVLLVLLVILATMVSLATQVAKVLLVLLERMLNTVPALDVLTLRKKKKL